MASDTYDPRYLQGIELFNRGEFFEAHHQWEEVWLDDKGPSNEFYKGLIQVAIALHHFMSRILTDRLGIIQRTLRSMTR